jgi:hypothetical protein
VSDLLRNELHWSSALTGESVVRIVIMATSAAAALFSLPAFTQQPSQGTAPIPDFSGIWGHIAGPGFEPPPSGPGPITNRSRRNGVSGAEFVGDYTNPILKPQAAEIIKKLGEISLTGVPYPTPSNQCWPGGVPYVFWNHGIQILQQPHQITILYSNDHEVRHVRMNQPHPSQVAPSWYGDSIGHYEGETLLIDTIGIKADRPLAMLDQYGTPYTKALHVVERYRMLDYEGTKEAEERGDRENFRIRQSSTGLAANPDYKGNGLLLQFTVEDEGVFTTPWSAAITYRRPLGEWPEMVCAETSVGHFFGKKPAVPTADKPDF